MNKNDEDKPGGAPVVVLSYGFWQRRFGGQPSVVNQQLTFNNKSYTVIGVMPQDPARVEMWVPVGPLSRANAWLPYTLDVSFLQRESPLATGNRQSLSGNRKGESWKRY